MTEGISIIKAAHDAYRLSQDVAFSTSGCSSIAGENVDLRKIHECVAAATLRLLTGTTSSLTEGDKAALGVIAYAVHVIATVPDEPIARNYIAQRTSASYKAYHGRERELTRDFAAVNKRSFVVIQAAIGENWTERHSLSRCLRTLGI